MATSPTQIRIDETTKQQAVALLEGLGLNLSDAVNIFLKQVILQNGIPFEIKYPKQKREPVAIGSLSKEQLNIELEKGLKSIEEGRVYTADEVEIAMLKGFGV